jgi:hypothetical protein
MDCYIDKKTGTYAETLEVVGLASAAHELGFCGVRVKDKGTHFHIHSEQDSAAHSVLSAGYPYIWLKSKEPERPTIRFLDYEGEKEKRDAAKKVGKKAKTALDAVEIEAPAVHPELNPATMLASMRKGWNGDRDIALWVKDHPEQAANWVVFRLGLGAQPSEKFPEVSNTQILNPISGKGVHAGKTEIRSSGSLPGQLVDSFSEWMKMRGLWGSALLYRSDDDFKFFVIEPADIAVDEIEKLRSALQAENLWGGVQLDIYATLQCTRILILQSDAVQDGTKQDGTKSVRLRGRKPRAVIAGLRQAYFKSLGTAAALMNDAFLPLPDWFAVHTEEDANAYLSIIDEAIAKGGCLKSLQEKHSDDGHILQQYREWLLSGELTDLLEFHYLFALHVMQCLSRKDWVRPFGTENLSILLTRAYEEKHQVTEIIENPGFQSVARALRNATVYALTIPSLRREVRFGIAQKWKQKIKAGDEEFAAELAEFVQEYNWETAHRLKGKGHSVTTEDLDALLLLIHERKADLVGALLLAYGYARAPKIETAQPEEAVAEV